jgi:hypothetical protein
VHVHAAKHVRGRVEMLTSVFLLIEPLMEFAHPEMT